MKRHIASICLDNVDLLVYQAVLILLLHFQLTGVNQLLEPAVILSDVLKSYLDLLPPCSTASFQIGRVVSSTV